MLKEWKKQDTFKGNKSYAKHKLKQMGHAEAKSIAMKKKMGSK